MTARPRPAAKPATTVSVAVAPSALAPVPLRRLTNEEYNNTVRDLLGDHTRPADAFPPDEVIGGFENNTVSPVAQPLVERYMSAAEALAARASKQLSTLAPCAAQEAAVDCAGRFIERFGRLAYRRPVTEQERASLLEVFSEKEKTSGYEKGVVLVLEAMLQSPKFLYRIEPTEEQGSKPRALDGFELASRLSFFLWASTPDSALLDDAQAGKLSSSEGLAKVARRMVKDPRAEAGIRSFHRQWLDLRKLETESKDATLYPAFTNELKTSMIEETLRFGSHAVLEGGDSFKTLLTSNKSYINAPLAKLYGVNPPTGSSYGWVELPSDQRAGVLTQASVMSVLANAEQTSPILRGKFVREKILCQVIPPPPPNAANNPPKFNPKLTKKEQFAIHQKDPSCGGCHQMMDPIGFGFEHYDAVGAWRTVEGQFPVDSLGEMTGADSANGAFDGAIQLGERLASSQSARKCFATQWFRAAVGRLESDDDSPALESMYAHYVKANFDVKELLVAIVTSDAFRYAGVESEAAR